MLRVTEPDGTVRVLVDPTALDPAGTTTLDAWQPSWEGDRLAYQLSVGGDEESQLFVLDVGTGEVVDGHVFVDELCRGGATRAAGADHVHAQGRGEPGDLAADTAEADQEHGLAAQLAERPPVGPLVGALLGLQAG